VADRYLTGVKGVSNLIIVKPRVSPNEMKAKIEEAFNRSAELDTERIAVNVERGKVTLSRKVRSWAEREEAAREA
jgi:osmotically-inducible protein OsmY